MKILKRHPLWAGTVTLTVTGLITRLIGFFYRIYLARLFGAEGMGIYQLISPVLALTFSLAASGYQTSISKFVAETTVRQHRASYRPLFVGLSLSLPLSLLCTLIVYGTSESIAASLLLEPRTASLLRILAFSIPFCSVHACINGYFYGRKQTGVPAATQLLEQCCRVGCVYALSTYALAKGRQPSIRIAVFGLAAGEFLAMLISVLAIYRLYTKERPKSSGKPAGSLAGGSVALPVDGLRTAPLPAALPNRKPPSLLSAYRQMLGMALPLTANRIVLNLLHSLEAVSIPAGLRRYGYDTAAALSVYGVLTGMAMPMIFFPNALTSSVSVLLLPLVSGNYAIGDMGAVRKAVLRTVKYCIILGFCCMGIFLVSGRWMGDFLFHSSLAGHFILTLSFICPFLYLDTTLSSILQGLGMAGRLFTTNIISLLVRLGFIYLTIPRFGITGYLWGILASQILLTFLYFLCLFRNQGIRSR
ncbi:MAG: polysaccharide biosynthesis protein [Clostridium sp.]|jgi:stage V sporulation protein B|nr:polysaccharide biosynthesis protein [Clostridium sp.]